MTVTFLEAKELRKHFPVKRGLRELGSVRAVDGVNLYLREGETLGLVGESGCGKSTLLSMLLRLAGPTSGKVYFKGRDLNELSKQESREYRRAVQPVFQNPFSSLDPRMRTERIISEPLKVNTSLGTIAMAERVAEVLRMVGLHASDAERFPHEFSGGQRQRIAIARALASEPRVLILDEAVSSQDISIRAQILNLLRDLQARFGLSYLFVAHDLATVRYMSDRISVMYLGKIVETAPAEQLCTEPFHPYTQALFAACLPDEVVPRETTRPLETELPMGELPSPMNPPSGCRFHTRCPHAKPICSESEPALKSVGGDRYVACVLYS
jgi:oligopeptide/dipeptide ABC transporter ATP-binding protein